MNAEMVSSNVAFPLADRNLELGTETAYKVALDAAKLKEAGKTVYPFHIGDLNVPTPDHVKKACTKALTDGFTGYCPSSGIMPLRQILAEKMGKERGISYAPENVCVQVGGKPIILKFLLCTMNPGDEVLYPTPGYPIYESLIPFLGGVLKPYTYRVNARGQFEIDLDHMKSQITPKTRIMIVNNPSNPTGALSTDEELNQLADIAKNHNMMVLSDEPYYHLVYEPNGKNISIAALPEMKDRTVVAWTFSKSFSMTGWRIGAALGPVNLINLMSKMNTNIEGCTATFIQHAAVEVYQNEVETTKFVDSLKAELKSRRDALVTGLKSVPGFKAIPGPSTFYLWVDVSDAVKVLGLSDVEVFRRKIMDDTGVVFCTRDHFGKRQPFDKGHHVRFAYSSADIPMIKKALEQLRTYMESQATVGSGKATTTAAPPTAVGA